MIKILHYLFIRDWPLKFFSLALAVLTWLAVSFSIRKEVVSVAGPVSTSERTFYDLRVVVMSTAADVHDYTVQPAEVDVTVQGDEAVLSHLQRDQIHPMVDLTDIASADNLRKRIQVFAPPGVTFTKVAPEEVDVVVPPSTNRSEPAPSATNP